VCARALWPGGATGAGDACCGEAYIGRRTRRTKPGAARAVGSAVAGLRVGALAFAFRGGHATAHGVRTRAGVGAARRLGEVSACGRAGLTRSAPTARAPPGQHGEGGLS